MVGLDFGPRSEGAKRVHQIKFAQCLQELARSGPSSCIWIPNLDFELLLLMDGAAFVGDPMTAVSSH